MEEFLSRQTLLVVAPHADDETIQAGGLIQRVKAAGGKAYVLVMSVGNLDHYTGDDGSHVEASTRNVELATAMDALGVDGFVVGIPRRDEFLLHLVEKTDDGRWTGCGGDGRFRDRG